jgi:hypothetical protein
MDPKSPSSCHPTDVEEEDSPLQQSTFASSQPMVDSYLEDIASKAKENAKDQTAEDMVEEEEQDGRARAEETEQGGGFEAEEVEQTPVNLHGYWVKCHVKDAHVLALEKEGTVAPKVESQWRTYHKALVPAPNKTEIIIIKSHIERGLSMLPSHFFSNLLQFYGLQLHHIAPNSLVSVAGYAALCEGYLGILPRVDLFQLFSQSGPILRMTDFLGPVEQSIFFLGGPKIIPSLLHSILL